MDEGQLLEDVLRGRGGLRLGRLLPALEPQPVEEHLAELHGGVDVELALGEAVDLLREGRELPLHVAAHAAEERHVHLHPRPLEVGQDLDERHLHLLVDREEALGLEPLGHRPVEAQDELGLPARGLAGGDGRRLGGGDAVGAGRAALADVLHREVLEGVGPPAGVEEVGGDEGVEGEVGDPHAEALEDDPVPLRVGARLADLLVLEQRAKRLERLLAARGLRDVDRRVREGHVRGAAGRPGEGDPEGPGPHRLGARDHDAERDPLRLAGLGHDGLDLRSGREQPVLGRRRLRDLRGVLPGQGLELELLEEGVGGRPVGLLPAERLEVEGHGGVGAQRDEPPREEGVRPVALQPLAVGRALHLVGVLEDALHRAELADEVARALVADAGDAGHVVDRVAHEGEHVGDALGRHPPLLLHGLPVEPRRAAALAAGVQDDDVLRHELEQVLVGGDHDHSQALLHRLAGESGDRVVGLVARHLDHRHPQGLAHPADVRQLDRESVVHLRAVGLVLRVLLVAERLPRRVEEHDHVLGTLVLEELAQHGGEAVGGVRGQPLAGGEAADRVEGAVDLAGAVDEVDRLRGGHLRGDSGPGRPAKSNRPAIG